MARVRSRTTFYRQLRVVTFAAAVFLPLLTLWVLLISDEAVVPLQQRPDAQAIYAAQDAIRQVRQVQGAAAIGKQVRLDNRMLQGLATLAADASGLRRLTAGVVEGTFKAAASVPLPAGLWINASVAVAGEHEGFPDVYLRAGSVSLPPRAARWAAEAARWALNTRGAQLPPFDKVIARVAVGQQDLVAGLHLPAKTGVIDSVVEAGGAAVDIQIAARVYCRLTTRSKEAPDARLASQVRHAFSEAPTFGTEGYNRAAFVGLALFVVGAPAEVLAPSVRPLLRTCGRPRGGILLSNRADLAMHWALSAALGAVLGDKAAVAVGEWKELSDSLPSGSGFSFMDLAADRSGLHTARRAVDPKTAGQTARELAGVTEEQIFPVALSAAQEGLSEQQFIARFGTVETAQYQEMVSWIDRELDRVRSR